MPVPSFSASPVSCKSVPSHTTGVTSFPHTCCGVTVTSESAWKRHVNGKKHVASSSTATAPKATALSPAPTASTAVPPALGHNRSCVVCDVACPTDKLWTEHINGTRHQNNVDVAERAYKRGIQNTITYMVLANQAIPFVDKRRIPSPPPPKIRLRSEFEYVSPPASSSTSTITSTPATATLANSATTATSMPASDNPHRPTGLETSAEYTTTSTPSTATAMLFPGSLSYVPTLLDAPASVPHCLRSNHSPASFKNLIRIAPNTPATSTNHAAAQPSLVSSPTNDVLVPNGQGRSPLVKVKISDPVIDVPLVSASTIPSVSNVPDVRVSIPVVPVFGDDVSDDDAKILLAANESLQRHLASSERNRFFRSLENGLFLRGLFDVSLDGVPRSFLHSLDSDTDEDPDDWCDGYDGHDDNTYDY